MNSPPAKPYLSKSRLISAWQCSKKLYLEVHNPELAETSSLAESLFATGNQVGEIAQHGVRIGGWGGNTVHRWNE